MNIFPGNILVIDDQFNLCYQNETDDALIEVQRENFLRLKNFFDSNGFFYSAITETKDVEDIQHRMKSYQNVRMLILDLDLDESGEVEDSDIAMVKSIILYAIKIYGYFFLAINSSYEEKWIDIKNELIEELEKRPSNYEKELNFLNNHSISFNKDLKDIDDKILDFMTNKFSHELITQFECNLNKARDIVLSPFLDVKTKTWDRFYHILKDDIDSKEHINLVLNSFLLGLVRQQLVDTNYTEPTFDPKDEFDETMHINIIKGFNYLYNNNNQLEKHPIWTGNVYFSEKNQGNNYILIITPECDIAQSKGDGYVVLKCFEINEKNLPEHYKAENYTVTSPPYIVEIAGKGGDGKWKGKTKLKDFLKTDGFYPLLYASLDNNHIIVNHRSVFTINEEDVKKLKLLCRINEPVITDIMDKFSAIFNRKGLPKLTKKSFDLLEKLNVTKEAVAEVKKS